MRDPKRELDAGGKKTAPADAGTITETCANRAVIPPHFWERPGFEVACTIAGEGVSASGKAGNDVGALISAEAGLCAKGIEINGLSYTCDYVPVASGRS